AVPVELVTVSADSEHGGYEAWRALDGDLRTMWHSDFSSAGGNSRKARAARLPHTLTVDFGKSRELRGFTLTPRRDGEKNGAPERYEVFVGDAPELQISNSKLQTKNAVPAAAGEFPAGAGPHKVTFAAPVRGRYFTLRVLSEHAKSGRFASVAEIAFDTAGGTVFRARKTSFDPADLATVAGADAERVAEFIRLSDELRQKVLFARLAPETFHRDALILAEDCDPVDVVLRRVRALYNDLRTTGDAAQFAAFGKRLDALQKENAGEGSSAGAASFDNVKERFALFLKLCALRREIAFANPLLNFDKLLFVKKHRATFNHMCDQYYGVNLPAGGGIFILENPFAKNGKPPVLTNVLENSIVQSGRLAGTKLTSGSFLSPDISFDGKKLAFAYVECAGDTKQRFHTDPSRGHWNQQRCFHIFTCDIDGKNLRQITDGTWNDFDPCWLPNGRMAFITERRGGYLRCGRECPTYTLFDMNPDGSKMRCLSYHETNEWQPSVTNDGRILWTRWDYPDRHGCTAHQPWLTSLDGRDPRHVHGNFAPRKSRPDMELDCRAIPNSPKFIATAAPHHGQSYGSLVLIDPLVVETEQDPMAPVKRLTPHVGFPESQGGRQVYGAPWPLSEKYYIAVADFEFNGGAQWEQARLVNGKWQNVQNRGKYGVYLVDCFGNKELVYRDENIGCNSPMPVAARPVPPVPTQQIADDIEHQPFVVPTREKLDKLESGKVLVLNAYESLKPLPENTKIKALRIIQLVPMSVPSGNPPHEIGFREPTSGDSVVLARNVLGTVPVESDGSAHFEVPPRREFMLQILDENGLAVQSMRSSIYLHDGEVLSCTGCHEQTANAPKAPARVAKAFQRKPSKITPSHPDANPFSYARLVQPVLDKNCVACHDKERAAGNARAINLGREPIRRKWFASFNNLVPKFGFYSYGNPLRTYPGKFGARASKLYPMLKAGHKGVKLTADELNRIVLWLDCVSPFYGVYEREGGIAQLKGEIAYPTLE
ncbi:MAG: discoidin domain-containing protein, partial [Puniceicoccales bacterium]|nr:discoidin domain-containing protein [Puniceicoccales bacterium]